MSKALKQGSNPGQYIWGKSIPDKGKRSGGGSEPGMNLVSLRGNKGAVWLKKRMSRVRAVRMRLDGQQGGCEELGFE